MATILLVEDAPDLGLYEAGLLADRGHRIVRCGGAPTPQGACPLLRYGACPQVPAADVILFSVPMFCPIRGRSYSGLALLRAYRDHPDYGRIPMVVVSVGIPERVGGSGPLVQVEKHADPRAVVEAVEAALAMAVPVTV